MSNNGYAHANKRDTPSDKNNCMGARSVYK